ncbi:hypothetical protein N9L47_08490 [Rhodobacteraceae bacterium]|nr:hypothetical protein [Paracoccaceae bacterium]
MDNRLSKFIIFIFRMIYFYGSRTVESEVRRRDFRTRLCSLSISKRESAVKESSLSSQKQAKVCLEDKIPLSDPLFFVPIVYGYNFNQNVP